MAVRVDASGDSLSIAGPTAPFTACFWNNLQVSGAGSYDALIAFDSAATFLVGMNNDVLIIYNGADVSSGITIKVGRWYYFAVTVDSSTTTVYLDSKKVVSAPNTGLGTTYYICNDAISEWSNSRHANHIVYNGILTPYEIYLQSQQHLPIRGDIWAWWELRDHLTGYLDKLGKRNLTPAGTLTTESGPPLSWELLNQETFPLISTEPAGQLISPNSDVSNAGSWTTSNLFEKVDETTASDADFISSPSAPSNAVCVLGLGDASDPNTNIGHKVRTRYRKGVAGSHRMDLQYRLMQGAVQKALWTATDIGTSFVSVEQALSASEADSITDYSDLRIELSANKVTTSTSTPTFVGNGTGTSTVGAATPALPLNWLENDVFILCVETANEAVTAPSGWTEITGSPQGTGTAAGTAATRLTVFWRRAVAGDTAPTISDAGDHIVAQISAWRGCPTSGDPWDVTAGDVEASSTTSVTCPSVTTTVDNCLILNIVSTATDSASNQHSATWTNTGLLNITKRTDANGTAGNGGGFGISTGVKVSAGSTGSTTETLTTASVQGRITIALKPIPIVDTTCDVSWIQFRVPSATGFRLSDLFSAMI